jgi:hypothetical protein
VVLETSGGKAGKHWLDNRANGTKEPCESGIFLSRLGKFFAQILESTLSPSHRLSGNLHTD